MNEFSSDDLPRAWDGREPFPVTDPWFDAPDGAVLDLSGDNEFPERAGLWQRHGDVWVPVGSKAKSASEVTR
ncbi:hypothetical protein [Amycolatopsis keratiniphila]|uniref:hypothetical protein n=1 Tax=Amycolatopsis keratiniphila TaxID=129921 RepID=UPI00087D8A70|nr:hypothetical protein [Amycolatopsis keratiniphila]OLZ56103.1 hypothetical protein BS330_18420 [Amycolatopsis keratiniphila subsp. nogabecina]SDU51807.1 hypothetical protein SAMN04489733_5348 [Amycolatopsis keratiniphila]